MTDKSKTAPEGQKAEVTGVAADITKRDLIAAAAAFAGLIIASREPFEDIESTLPSKAKRLADLFSCRESTSKNRENQTPFPVA